MSFTYDEETPTLDTGVWKEFEGSKFLIAHISNMKFQRALARLQQPHKRKIEQGTIDPQVNKQIVAKAMAEGLLLDWKDVKNKEGAQTPYSTKAAEVALMKKPEFRDFVSDVSMNLEQFREEEIESVGNDSSIG